jgi:hypothetical protein
MTEKPDFSRDTGPGVPEVDNIYTPGWYYSSSQVEDTGCALCRRKVGYWEHDGTQLYGTEGQKRRYVWTLAPQDIPAKCTICDDCLEPIIARGDLELCRDDQCREVGNLSKASIKALFTQGARETINIFAEIKETPEALSDFILPLTIIEIEQMMNFADQTCGYGNHANVGNSYALAALAFDKVLRDPSFEDAADYYVEIWLEAQRLEWEAWEALYSSSEDLYEQLLEATRNAEDTAEDK